VPLVATTPAGTGLGATTGGLVTPNPATTEPLPAATATASTSTSSGGGLSGTDEIALFLAGALLFVGIALVIRHDARSHTPDGPIRELDTPRGTATPPQLRVQRQRAKAKAARKARRSGR
jgi:hypothetical protein